MKQQNGYVLTWDDEDGDPAEFCKTLEAVRDRIKAISEEDEGDNFKVYKTTHELEVVITDVVVR